MDILSIVIGAAAFLVNGGALAWMYKIMQDQMKQQAILFNQKIANLKDEIEFLKQSESRWINKYRVMFQHFKSHKCPNNGSRCDAFEKYMEKVEEGGAM